ncbi:hypothetical protein M758_UG169000 [Ceratodon purpureus]|nr:hypothetical protein M758_UG169000 [Ceratodon purpureus]
MGGSKEGGNEDFVDYNPWPEDSSLLGSSRTPKQGALDFDQYHGRWSSSPMAFPARMGERPMLDGVFSKLGTTSLVSYFTPRVFSKTVCIESSEVKLSTGSFVWTSSSSIELHGTYSTSHVRLSSSAGALV